ncbi:MAG: NADH-quinone oxidoreductase subunit C [Acidimicrobiia bacterium]
MSTSPSEAATHNGDITLEDLAAALAEATGGEVALAFGTAKIKVPAEKWVQALTTARDRFGLVFFSWLSAVDWSNQVAVGDPLTEEVAERYEVIAAVADLSVGHIVLFTTEVPKDNPRLASLVEVYAGANWHEREAHEMFGIDFTGHPNLVKLYLPDGFEGYPLRKSFALLTREVKPWPGKVDVEGMPGSADEPSEENPDS